jgi:hypothetical protein
MKRLLFLAFVGWVNLIVYTVPGTCGERYMPDVKEYVLKCDGIRVRSRTIDLKITGEGVFSVEINWEGKAGKVRAKLIAPDGKRVLVAKTGPSPLELNYKVSGAFLRAQGNNFTLLITPVRGSAEGRVVVTIPVSKKTPGKFGSDLDKGELLTDKPKGLYPKGKSPRRVRLEKIKRPGGPMGPRPEGKNLKKPPKVEPKPVLQRKEKEEEEGLEGRYAVIRMQIIGEEIKPIFGVILEGPLVVSTVVSGDLLYEVSVGRRTLALGTFADPRFSRVYLKDGTSRRGYFPDRPRLFKVCIPGKALRERLLRNMVVNLYSIPGELGLRKIDINTFYKVKRQLKLISRTEPGMIYKVLLK